VVEGEDDPIIIDAKGLPEDAELEEKGD